MALSEENWVLCPAVGDVDDVDDVDDDADDGDDDDVDEMREKNRHPFAQTNDTGNLTKHWPCAVKTHFPGQHIRPGCIYIYIYIYIYMYIYIYHISRIYQPHYPMIFPLNTTVIHLPFGDLCALLEAAEVGALLRRSHGCLGSSGYRHGGYLWGSISSMV